MIASASGMFRRARAFRALARSRAGVAMIEFALLAPVMLAMLFGLIEGGRMYWIKQTLNEVAYATARCMSVNTTCETKSYAADRARAYAVLVEEEHVVPTGNTVCKGVADSNQVAITHQFNSPMKGFLPFLPDEISATACFPVLA